MALDRKPVHRKKKAKAAKGLKPKRTAAQRRSARNKGVGRKFQQEVAQMISNLIGLPWGKDEMIASREASQSGSDIRLVGEAARLFPFSVECKDRQSWNIPVFISQAKANAQKEKRDWLLFLKRTNRKAEKRVEPVVVLSADLFFAMLSGPTEIKVNYWKDAKSLASKVPSGGKRASKDKR